MRERDRFVDALRAAMGENDNPRPGAHAAETTIVMIFNTSVIVKEKK